LADIVYIAAGRFHSIAVRKKNEEEKAEGDEEDADK